MATFYRTQSTPIPIHINLKLTHTIKVNETLLASQCEKATDSPFLQNGRFTLFYYIKCKNTLI